jgi:hypothetical protein
VYSFLHFASSQGLWWEENDQLALKMLPHINGAVLDALKERGISSGSELLSSSADHVRGALRTVIGPPQVNEFIQVSENIICFQESLLVTKDKSLGQCHRFKNFYQFVVSA